jgi:glyoxylase-like metal-dependent hydrolase (beta-lactamase superfamily II)
MASTRTDHPPLHYPIQGEPPAPGEVRWLRHGLGWLRMKLPFALDHINLWLLADHDEERGPGWVIVDCGVANEATRAAWEQVFAEHLQGLPVLRLICTHMHPDHIGNAMWLSERWGQGRDACRLWISATDWNAARMASASTTGHGGSSAADFFASHGLRDEASLAKVRARSNYYASMVPEVPARFRRLMDGDVLGVAGKPWRCIAGYGHAPEHIALHDAQGGVLISGDMLLPRISTNVSVIDIEPEANPLPLFLNSLTAYEGLPASTLVLPSHGLPFVGLHARIRQLREHHEARLAEVLAACAERPCSAADMLPLLFKRELDLHQTTFAMGEAVAHLHALWFEGRLKRERGIDGVFRFRRGS